MSSVRLLRRSNIVWAASLAAFSRLLPEALRRTPGIPGYLAEMAAIGEEVPAGTPPRCPYRRIFPYGEQVSDRDSGRESRQGRNG